MMILLKTIFYIPLYNGLIFLINHVPSADLGIAVILFTCLVKFILLPLSKGAVRTQIKMRELEPELNEIKEKYKDNKEEQARQMLEFYKTNKLNPFASIFLVILQIPVIIALAAIFYRSGLPNIETGLLYSFVHVPEKVNTFFLGLFDINKKSIPLSFVVGITQYIQVLYSVPAYKSKKKEGENKDASFSEDMAKNMNMQMRYVMPAISFVISLGFSAAISLYWITSNVFTFAQEVYFRRTIKKGKA